MDLLLQHEPLPEPNLSSLRFHYEQPARAPVTSNSCAPVNVPHPRSGYRPLGLKCWFLDRVTNSLRLSQIINDVLTDRVFLGYTSLDLYILTVNYR